MTARLLLSPSAVESTPVLQDFDLFGYSMIWIFLHFFPVGSYPRSVLSAGGYTESTRLLTGPRLTNWAFGCRFGALLFV